MTKKYTILVIEDNIADFDLLEQALLRVSDVELDIINIQTGKEAVDFLFDDNKKNPNIIILDLNLPQIGGLEILKRIKSDNKLKIIPTIIYSTSSHPKDIEESYKEYANSYIVKEFDLKRLFNKIALAGQYWFKTSELPNT